jgi:hypothetical protein
MQIFATIITGVVVFILAGLAKTYVLDPLAAQRKVLGEIDFTLIYLGRTLLYAAEPCEPRSGEWNARAAAEDTLRRLGGRLRATTAAIVWYPMWERLGLVVPLGDLQKAGIQLLELALLVAPTTDAEELRDHAAIADDIRHLLRRYPPGGSQKTSPSMSHPP